MLIALVCAVYAFADRYYLRFVPVPVAAIDLLYGADGPAPDMTMKGHIDFPVFDITDSGGLRAALDHIRAMNPLRGDGTIHYENITLNGWLAQLRAHPMYCTDATALFMALAHQSGYRAREWWLWGSSGYRDGNAHSVAEFYNPVAARWQLIDAQTATIVYRTDGTPASLADVLRGRAVVFDRSPRVVALDVASLDTEHQIASNSTPVLNLKPPQFLASTPKTDLVIAYAVLVGNGRHSVHVFLTKGAVALGLLCLGMLAVISVRQHRSLTA